MKTITCDKRTLNDIMTTIKEAKKIGLGDLTHQVLQNKCLIYSMSLILNNKSDNGVTIDYTRILPAYCSHNNYIKICQESFKEGSSYGLYENMVRYEC